MLSDRPYMRQNYPRPERNMVFWLISALIACFILQLLMGSPGLVRTGAGAYRFLQLTPGELKSSHIWTLLTYSLLHDPRNFLLVVSNAVALYFLGRELTPLLGNRRFFGLYAASVIVGGLAWVAAHWTSPDQTLMGATAGVIGLMTVFACFYPNQQITLLLFFIIPVTLKPKYIVYGLLAFDLIGCTLYEVLGASSPLGFAHSAHLGGMLTGWIYYRYIHEGQWRWRRDKVEIETPRWVKKSPAAAATVQTIATLDLSNRAQVRAEVDRILDKINSHGFGSLTADEKRLLDEAKDLLSRQ